MRSDVVKFSASSSSSSQNTDRPLHVLHLIEALGPGGAERLLYTNLKHLDRTRIRSSVLTVFSHAMHWQAPIRELGITVGTLNCKSPRDLAAGIRRLSAWLRANQPDLIHSHLWSANVIARLAGRMSGVPVISSVHNPDHEIEAWADGSNVSLLKRRLARDIDRWTSWFGCTRMVAVSNYVKHSAHRHLRFPLERIELLYNPIDFTFLEDAPQKNRSELLSELGLPADALMLLNVARVSPQKGLLYAVRALPEVLKRYPSAHLISVGETNDPEWLTHLRSEAERLGVGSHTHILGARQDVIDFFRSCDLFVFPSLYEGLGIALLEAMATGCACVAIGAGPIPEIVQNGNEAVLVPPANPGELSRAICNLLDDPSRRAELGVAARRAVLERFQPKEAAERLRAIYESVIKTNGKIEDGLFSHRNVSPAMKTLPVRQQTQAVIEHFDKLSASKDWSHLYAVTDGKTYHFHVRRERVLELLPEKLGLVLDVGCGPGVMVEAVLARGGRFEGRDLSPEMIKESREQFGHLPNVNFQPGDIEQMNLPDASCDQVIAMAVIEYLRSPDRALAEIARVLRPGGIAIITVPKRWHIDKPMISLTAPLRWLARVIGIATGDRLPRLCLQPDELNRAAERAGLVFERGSQYNFTLFPYALPRLAPQLSMRLNVPFEHWHDTKSALKSFFAHGYVGRYRRASVVSQKFG